MTSLEVHDKGPRPVRSRATKHNIVDPLAYSTTVLFQLQDSYLAQVQRWISEARIVWASQTRLFSKIHTARFGMSLDTSRFWLSSKASFDNAHVTKYV